MKNPVTLLPHRLIVLAAATAFLLAGCASQKSEPTTQFDFGPAIPSQAAQAAPAQAMASYAIVVTDATGSSALDSERMFYRLSYADPLQARTYANSRWTANPLQMTTQRLKTRIAQSGAKVLSETDASSGVAILR
ncbi:MAG: ABC transporter, partial [Telluria sp.]